MSAMQHAVTLTHSSTPVLAASMSLTAFAKPTDRLQRGVRATPAARLAMKAKRQQEYLSAMTERTGRVLK